ncbi:SigE family RNA polymerase sigma factor [Actinomadura alba]|uniref:SigE family RNA polymerase sigma factor n=1 Tax=Actinomadura alba TaxID=406431 RepID=A0ABR7LU84_9ACTN|nr:SigE family RNA polymerase sigma factor [Actinomadura alba]MBC6468057.1 SigE family RNA polymerase sigma factor [Actinomadura alba]
MRSDRGAEEEFHRFFERHHRELARLAYLLTGDPDAADDLAADALAAAWRRWDRVGSADQPLAYVRKIVVNLAGSRVRGLIRERKRLSVVRAMAQERIEAPDVPAAIDVRAALQRLPARKRACVVLRHAFDLSEQETARLLGISVGTVKSQTSKGVAELERVLRAQHEAIGADGRVPPVTPPGGRQPFGPRESTSSAEASSSSNTASSNTASGPGHRREP